MIRELNAVWCEVDYSQTELIEKLKTMLRARPVGIEFNPYFKNGMIDGYRKYYKEGKKGELRRFLIPRPAVPRLVKALEGRVSLGDYKDITKIPAPSKTEFEVFLSSLKLPFTPYDYQLKAAYDSLVENNQINIMCTSSGKSLVIYILVRWFLSKSLKTILVVPNISLLTQMRGDFIDYGWRESEVNKYVTIIGGDSNVKQLGQNLTITTWQSLKAIKKQLETVDAFIEDECHRAASDVHIFELFPHTTKTMYRLGFTGTLPPDKLGKLALACSFGEFKTYITARELIDRGLATPISIKTIFLKHPLHMVSKATNFANERKVVLKYPPRHKAVLEVLSTLKGNTVVLFDRIEHGKALCEDYSNLNSDRKIYYIDGSTSKLNRECIRRDLEFQENAILFGSIQLMGTGINIKSLVNVVFVSGGKSYITVNQSIGRVLRKSGVKSEVFLYDFVDVVGNDNYLLRHYQERSRYYLEQKYPIEEKVIHLS